MKEIFPFSALLAVFAAATFLIILFPEMMAWKLVALKESSPPVKEALQSMEFQISLIVSLSVSAPMFFELLLRALLYGKMIYVLPNVLILTFLAIPDLIILCYVRVFLDYVTLNIILQVRFILFSWLAFIFIKKYGGNNWSTARLTTIFILICSARILGVFKAYVNQQLYDILDAFGIILDCLVCMAFPITCVQWYTYLLNTTKSVAMSTNQYMCNIYVTAYLLTCFGIAMILYTSPNTLDLMKWNANELTLHTLMYTVFYIIVIIFEGRVLQREMLQARYYLSFRLKIITS